MNLPAKVIDSFWERVDKKGEDECWLWTGATSQGSFYGKGQDYGRLSWRDGYNTITQQAHVLSCMIHKIIIPEGFTVNHLCNNGLCVNPKHLSPATSRDNQQYTGWNAATLTEDKVIEIRKRYAVGGTSQQTLAFEFGVSQPQIYRIVNKICWKEV